MNKICKSVTPNHKKKTITRVQPCHFFCLYQARTWISSAICQCYLFVFNELEWEVVVCCVDIDWILDHHCLNFLFHNDKCLWKSRSWLMTGTKMCTNHKAFLLIHLFTFSVSCVYIVKFSLKIPSNLPMFLTKIWQSEYLSNSLPIFDRYIKNVLDHMFTWSKTCLTTCSPGQICVWISWTCKVWRKNLTV